MAKRNTTKKSILKLNGQLTVQRAAELKNTLLENMNKKNDLIVNHESVDEFDITYIQLLIAAKEYSTKIDKTFEVAGNNKQFENLLSQIGLNDNL